LHNKKKDESKVNFEALATDATLDSQPEKGKEKSKPICVDSRRQFGAVNR